MGREARRGREGGGAGRRIPLLILAFGPLLTLAAVLLLAVEYHLSGEPEGLYLLRGTRRPLEVRTDLYLGEEGRLLLALPVAGYLERVRGALRGAPVRPELRLDWDEAAGEGYVLHRLGGGRMLLSCFSRYLDDEGRAPAGIFLGGGLPYDVNRPSRATLNDTGMAFFDGRRWFHLWCNVNEMVAPAAHPERRIYPSAWEYLGSRVEAATRQRVEVADRHRLVVDGVPLRVDKTASFRAGEPYFILRTTFLNEGEAPVSYYYLYGDEPWVGDYGTSRGNIGWIQDAFVKYEGAVDTARTRFAGYCDYGNDVLGAPRAFTGAANFIEWPAASTPDLVYFTNRLGPLHQVRDRVPLFSLRGRFLGLQWGPRTLAPRESVTYEVAVGMAQGDREHWSLPRKPPVRFPPAGPPGGAPPP